MLKLYKRSYLYSRWESVRTGGLLRFVLVWGVLNFAVCSALVLSLVGLLFGWDSVLDKPLLFLCGPLGGAIWAAFLWRDLETLYVREQESAVEPERS